MTSLVCSSGATASMVLSRPSSARLPVACHSARQIVRRQLLEQQQCGMRTHNVGSRGRNSSLVVRAAKDPDAEAAEQKAFLADVGEKMEKSLDAATRNFGTVSTGRANPAMLDRVQVDYYGTFTPLRQIAGISASDSQTLVVQPYDISAMPNIEKAITKSDLGVMPNTDGKVIRINIPNLTKERRAEMSKMVSAISEEGKVAIRNIRRDAMKQVAKSKKDGDYSEDLAADLEKSVQTLTDDNIKRLDKTAAAKSDELKKI